MSMDLTSQHQYVDFTMKEDNDELQQRAEDENFVKKLKYWEQEFQSNLNLS